VPGMDFLAIFKYTKEMNKRGYIRHTTVTSYYGYKEYTVRLCVVNGRIVFLGIEKLKP